MGRVGNDPELKTGPEKDFVTFSLATNESWEDKENPGEYKSRVDWHNVIVFKPYLQESIMENVSKSQRVLVQGKISYLKREIEGTTVYTASIIADELVRLSKE